MSPWRLLFAALLFCPGPAAAAKLRVCTDVHPHPPHLMPDGGGSSGRIVAAAAREAGVELEFYAAPLARCHAEVRINLAHGFPMTPYLPDLLPFAQYPMRDGLPDPARATMHARIMLYRRSGSLATWDGARIAGLAGKVLVPGEGLATIAVLRKLGVPIDASGRSLEINLTKMMAGRAEVAAGFEEEGAALLALPEFAGRVEMLPLPLLEQPYFLIVTKTYYAHNRAAVDAMWDAIGRLNQAAKTQKK